MTTTNSSVIGNFPSIIIPPCATNPSPETPPIQPIQAAILFVVAIGIGIFLALMLHCRTVIKICLFNKRQTQPENVDGGTGDPTTTGQTILSSAADVPPVLYREYIDPPPYSEALSMPRPPTGSPPDGAASGNSEPGRGRLGSHRVAGSPAGDLWASPPSYEESLRLDPRLRETVPRVHSQIASASRLPSQLLRRALDTSIDSDRTLHSGIVCHQPITVDSCNQHQRPAPSVCGSQAARDYHVSSPPTHTAVDLTLHTWF